MLRLLRRIISISGLILVSIQVTLGAMEAPMGNDVKGVQFGRATVDDHQIHYAYAGNSEEIGLLFVHGTPGDWGAFERYLTNPGLASDFFMVSVDRLGWGQSPIPPKEINGEFSLQAKSLIAVMDNFPDKQWIIVGHSLGASIAPKVALLEPGRTKALLLLAGTLDPSLGAPRWYNRAASTWLVSRLIGRAMRHSNREIMGLRAELKDQAQKIMRQSLPVALMVLQGTKDRLVSPKNAKYVAREWQDNFTQVAVVELEGAGHFLPWRNTADVIKAIYQLTSDTNTSGL